MPVAEKRCSECLISANKIVSDDRRDELLKELAESGRAFICHRASMAGEYIVCRGFYDQGLSLSVVLARQLGAARFVQWPQRHP